MFKLTKDITNGENVNTLQKTITTLYTVYGHEISGPQNITQMLISTWLHHFSRGLLSTKNKVDKNSVNE